MKEQAFNPTYKEQLKNPFLPLKADNLKDEDIIKFFVNHTKCTPIANKGNQIVIGASGTGKTLAFRYFSFQNQLKTGRIDASSLPPFIGIYIALGKESDVWRKKNPTEDIFKFYENFLNIEILIEITKIMKYISKQNIWGITSKKISNLLQSSIILGSDFPNLIEFQENLVEKRKSIMNFIDRKKEPAIDEFQDTLNASINTCIPILSNIFCKLTWSIAPF